MHPLEGGSEPPIVAVDLGGTNTRVALVGADGVVIERDVEATTVSDSHPDNLVALVAGVARGSGAVRAVIGVPGRVNYPSGRLEYAPNLPPHWTTHLTHERLSASIGLDAALANDADLATVGEHRFGAGRGTSDMVYVTLSTGVGCGVILGNQLARGRRSIAEAGHTVIDRRAEPGRRTFEETASGTAMNRLAEEASLTARGQAVLELAQRGDPVAASVWDEIVAAAGIGIANLAHLYSPEVIVIGGGLGLAGEPLYGPIRAALAAHGPKDLLRPIRIAPAELGDDAGLIGVAGWTATERTTTEGVS
jgi:glucokinase